MCHHVMLHVMLDVVMPPFALKGYETCMVLLTVPCPEAHHVTGAVDWTLSWSPSCDLQLNGCLPVALLEAPPWLPSPGINSECVNECRAVWSAAK